MPQTIGPGYAPTPAVFQTTETSGNRNIAYYAAFTVGGQALGFDIRQNSYQENTQANATIRAVPWAATYTVVVQARGIAPRTRQYRAVLYMEQDYLNLQAAVGQTGILQTPREPNVAAVQNAVLLECRRDDLQNPGDPAGELTVSLSFQMLV